MQKMIFLLSILTIYTSCQTSTDWYPKGKVNLAGFRIVDAMNTRNCVLFYHITNTGISKITTTTFSLKIQSDLGTYYKTIINGTPIQPTRDIFGDYSISFLSNTEILTNSNNISISGSYFE